MKSRRSERFRALVFAAAVSAGITQSVLALAIDWLPMNCGDYQIYGVLQPDARGGFVLTVQKGSSGPVEFEMIGARLDEISRHLEIPSLVRVYAPVRIGSGSTRRILYFRAFLAAPLVEELQALQTRPVRLLEGKSCGQKLR